MRFISKAAAALLLTANSAWSIDIVIDFSLDTNNFFNTQERRNALQEVADRYSRVITSSLGAAAINNVNDGRIGFSHPGTGAQIEISGAANAASDSIVSAGGGAADFYGARTFATDTWTLFAGARPQPNAGVGGTGSGTNFTNFFTDDDSHLNRGFRAPGTSAAPAGNAPGSLPVWGGAVSFDSSRDWHFGIDTVAEFGESDFYSIALHEVGHALGLNVRFRDFLDHVSGDQFTGANAVAAANADNGTSLTDVDLVSPTNTHFADNDGNVSGGGSIPADPDAVQSFIFSAGNPNTAGTVGLGQLQDLLLEPIANTFFDSGNPSNTVARFELTNVDVGALEDVGWTVLEPITTLPGDYNNDLTVDAADYTVWRTTVGTPGVIGSYQGWIAAFGSSAGVVSSVAVPEPSAAAIWFASALVLGGTRRRSTRC